MRLLVTFTVLLWAVAAHAGGDCAAEFSDCREDCTLMYGGSVKVSNKKKFATCSKKCTRKKVSCEERSFETKRNALDEGSLDKSPTSHDVDESGLPTRTTVSKSDEDAPPVSTRTKLEKVQEPAAKADDDGPAPARQPEVEKRQPEVEQQPVREERPAPREEPKVHPTERKDPGDDLRDDGKRSSDDEEDDLRDDRPRKSDKRDKKRDPPRREEEDHDDLRYY